VSILVGRDTRLLVQGITGREGEFHSRAMVGYGTAVVAGVTPGKGGQTAVDGRVPVYDTVADAVRETGANASCIFVPAAGAPDSILEAVAAGIGTIFCITEGIPALDMIPVVDEVRRAGARLIGPNCPGATTPGAAKVGIIPGSVHAEGRVGVVSRSGTLTYEAVQAMTDAGIGQSTCVGIGGDPIVGSTFTDVLELFAADPGTEAVVLIGEIGGSAEEEAATFAAERLSDIPRVAFIAGRTAPEGRRMGHAGAIISGGRGTAASKIAALEEAGFRVAGSPTEIPDLLRAAGYRDEGNLHDN
jgi:succinyl-CoA synthetase alpha subunit